MQAALGVVLYIVVGVAGVLAVVALFRTGRTYDEIGRGGVVDAPAPDQRDEEIRQLRRARETRRAARGGPAGAPARIPEPDPALAAEISEHVERRNARLVARGAAPLDVEEEVRRRLADAAGPR